MLDPYFSGTKARWLIDHVDLPPAPRLRIGTIDSWLVWNLTGGAVFATDPTNASRTMLFDIGAMRWSTEMCDLIGVPMSALPEVRPSSGRIGVTAGVPGLADGIPVSSYCTTPENVMNGLKHLRKLRKCAVGLEPRNAYPLEKRFNILMRWYVVFMQNTI